MSRATEDMMDALHGAQAEELLAQFKKYKDSESGIIPPALFSQINKFLKDNGVDRAVTPGDPTSLLEDEMPIFDNVVEADFRST